MSTVTSTTVPAGTVVDTTADPRWTPLRVTATLAEAVAGLDTNPLHLDGPVSWGAYLAQVRAYGHDHLPPAGPDTCTDFGLPLATWTRPASTPDPHHLAVAATRGEVWGWACSAAHYLPLASTVVSVRRRPAVEAMVRYTSDREQHLSAGPLKARDVPYPAILVGEICWWVLGDPDRLQPLLAGVRGLGRLTRHGNGRVSSWSVTVDEAARQRWMWRQFPDPAGLPGTIRAPYHHPSRRMPCTTLGAPSWA